MAGILIDFNDSYTLNIWDAFRSLGLRLDIVSYTDIPKDWRNIWRPDYLVLSPGPYNPHHYPTALQILDHYNTQIPIIGICLGHQIIGLYYGATIVRAQHPIHGVPIQIQWRPNRYTTLSQSTVMPYNSLICQMRPQMPIQTIAVNTYDECMALIHDHLPILGLQFHPESVGTKERYELFEDIKRFILHNQTPSHSKL